MSNFQAVFKQSPVEVKRYVLDYTLFLSTGENIASIAVNVVQTAGAASPAFVVNEVALLPVVNGQVIGAAYFASGGVDGGVYEVQFLATTSIGQVLEDVVQYTLAENM
ncbi:MAG: hypothetical protein M3O20_01180 [Acidobacteriota bacterium]|nr:hypothetical protein [Acidobacteriota bacterium]